jgi:regulator of replication initiation timing
LAAVQREELNQLRSLAESLWQESESLRLETEALRQENERLRTLGSGEKPEKPPSFVKANRPQRETRPRKKRAADGIDAAGSAVGSATRMPLVSLFET